MVKIKSSQWLPVQVKIKSEPFFVIFKSSQICNPWLELQAKSTWLGIYPILGPLTFNVQVKPSRWFIQKKHFVRRRFLDGVTNFYSPCHAGCEFKSTIPSQKDAKKNTTLYSSCSCVKEAKEVRNTSITRGWIETQILPENHVKYPSISLIDEQYR